LDSLIFLCAKILVLICNDTSMEQAPKFDALNNTGRSFEGFADIERAKELHKAVQAFNGQTLVGPEGAKVESMSRELRGLLVGIPREVCDVHELPWHPMDAGMMEESVS